jgi:hypothetical protein
MLNLPYTEKRGMRNLKVSVALVVIGLAGPSSAKNLIYVSEKKAVCYIPAPDGLSGGHWECDLDTQKCQCVWSVDKP